MAPASSSAKEPFPLLNVDADIAQSNGAAASGSLANGNGNGARRRKQSGENGNLATSLAHMSGVDSIANGKVRLGLDGRVHSTSLCANQTPFATETGLFPGEARVKTA